MSSTNFDDNPFGEPMVDNPFADPIAPAGNNGGALPVPGGPPAAGSRTISASNSAILDEYNPFEHEPNRSVAQQQYAAGAQNPVQAGTTSVASPTPSAAQLTTYELQRRQEELDRKAAELERREAELRNGGASETRRNNWPPLPDKCCFQPCFYQDINVEIPIEFQRTVRHLYYLWSFYAIVLATNVLGGFILMFHDGSITFFLMSIIYACIFTPSSFLCWYRPAYKAFRSDSSVNFMVFFFIFFFQMIMLLIQTIGIQGSGYCGFITAISQFDGSASGIVLGLFMLMIAFSFATCTVGNGLLLTKIHSIYRSSNTISMSKAQSEFSTGFFQNQHVQRAAANAATSAVGSQFPSNRY